MKVVEVTDVGDTIAASDPRLSGTCFERRNCRWLGDLEVCIS